MPKKNPPKFVKTKAKSKKLIKTNQQAERVAQPVNIREIESTLPEKSGRSHHVVVKFDKVNMSFGTKANTTHIIKNISINFYSGEFVIIAGPSGSGKSTLLHILLGLEKPTSGQVFLRDTSLYDLSENERTQFRRKKIGMVFQNTNWIKALNVWENVAYPLWLFGISQADSKIRAIQMLEQVGLKDWANYVPTELSGGQQQRVSLARALITDPGILIADEPTGNLDTIASTEIITLLAKLNRIQRRMIIMVTHDTAFLPIANRKIIITDGRVVYDERN